MNIDKYLFNKDIEKINIFCIFINNKNEISLIKKNKYIFENKSILKKNELIYLIKKYNYDKKYIINHVLKYNIDLCIENIKFFLKYPSNFLIPIEKINDIKWTKSCEYLQNFNTLYLIYFKKNTNKIIKNKTLKKKNKKKINQKNKIKKINILKYV